MKRPVLWSGVAALAVLWALSLTTYVVSETEQALIIRLGAPVNAVSAPPNVLLSAILANAFSNSLVLRVPLDLLQ